MVRPAWWALALVTLASLGAFSVSKAATGLAIVTRDATAVGKLVKDAQPVQVYATPKAGDYVRVAPTEAEIWTTGKWKAWPPAAGDKYETCRNDAAEETWANATCTTWDVVAYSGPAVDPSVFTVDKTTGKAPLTVVLTWDCSTYKTATASGSWTGAKALKGTQTIQALAAPASYTLSCDTPAVPAGPLGSAVVTWTAPTTNVDNTPYTNAKGYFLFYDTTQAKVTDDATVGLFIPSTAPLSYTVSGLTSGTWYFAMRAVNATDNKSAPSGVSSKTIGPIAQAQPAAHWAQTLAVAVTPADTVPNPPVLKVVQTDLFRLDQNANSPRLTRVGSVPLQTPCTEFRVADTLTLTRVARSAAGIRIDAGYSLPNVPIAQCRVM